MEELIKLGVENGLGALSFIFMIVYIMFDKKQVAEEKKANNDFIQNMVKALDSNTATLTAVNDNQREMTNTLEKLNYKIENLENKINKGSD